MLGRNCISNIHLVFTRNSKIKPSFKGEKFSNRKTDLSLSPRSTQLIFQLKKIRKREENRAVDTHSVSVQHSKVGLSSGKLPLEGVCEHSTGDVKDFENSSSNSRTPNLLSSPL